MNVASQEVSVCILNPLDISSIAPLERYALGIFGLQGGGLYIFGTATLTDTNVYDNQASRVCSPFELSSSASLERYACSWLAEWRGTLHQGHGNADQHQRVR